MEKEIYSAPELSVLQIEFEEVICGSGGLPSDGITNPGFNDNGNPAPTYRTDFSDSYN